MEPKEINEYINSILTEQVKEFIKKEHKPLFFHIMMNGEPIETCKADEVKDKLEIYQKQHPDQELLIEPSKSKTFDEIVDELDEITDKLQESDMKKTRKIYALTEQQVENVVRFLVSEGGVPGLTVTDNVKKEEKKINDQNAKEVAAKLKKANSFEGNDNPEFPKPIGKGDKMLRKNTDKEQDEIDANENRTPLEIEYDSEPSEQFKDRAKKALEGDSTMGNGVEDGTNAVNGDVAKTIQNVSKKKMKAQEEEPLYKKEEVPVDEEGKHNDKKHSALNENIDKEIGRLKQLYNYNKKTQ